MTELLVGDFVKVFLIFLRMMGIFFSAPIFNSTVMPSSFRILLGFTIALILKGIIPEVSLDFSQDLLKIGVMGVKEIIIGLTIGYSLNMVFWGVAFGGSLVGRDIGLSMASVFNPAMDISSDIIGDIYNYVAIMLFFILNGHHFVIQSLYSSIKLIPLGATVINGSVLDELIRLTSGVFVIALKISAPIMVAFFLLNVAVGVTSRFIPQIQIFFILHPLHLTLGVIILMTSAPIIVYLIRMLLTSIEENLTQLLRLMGS